MTKWVVDAIELIRKQYVTDAYTKEAAEENRKNDFSKAQEKIDKKKDKILNEGDKKNQAMGKEANEKIKKAADRFIEKFMESV